MTRIEGEPLLLEDLEARCEELKQQAASLLEQSALSRPLHSSHVPSLWHAGVVELRASQLLSPLALSAQASHTCVLVLQMGLDAPQSLLALHCTQVLFAVLHTLAVASSEQSVLSTHSTHAPELSLHVVFV